MAELLNPSTYSGFYTTLNQIRAKHGYSNITTHTVSSDTPATSSQMSTLQNSVNEVKQTDGHLKDASINTTIPNISKGDRILLDTKTSIETILTNMLNVCHHNAWYQSPDYTQYAYCGADEGYCTCDGTDYMVGDS